MCRDCKYNPEGVCILNDNREIGYSYLRSRNTPKWCKIKDKYLKDVPAKKRGKNFEIN